jgi:hypothetical protein
MERVGPRSVGGCVARAALLPPAALAVHQLRFLLAFGRDAGEQLQATGHSYLHSIVPWLVLLLGVAAGLFLWAFGRALAGRRVVSNRATADHASAFVKLWLVCSLCLLAIYTCQELLEGWFAVGHATGFYGVFGMGGWWAIPASAGVGLVLAALFYSVHAVLDELATRRGVSSRSASPAALVIGMPRRTQAGSLAPVAAGWSDRGPPLLA